MSTSKATGDGYNKGSDKKKELPKGRGRAYTMTLEQARETPDVVSGTFPINNIYAHVLFDSGADGSFVSTAFRHYLNKDACRLEESYTLETFDGSQIKVDEFIDGCMLRIDGKELPVMLMPICLGEFHAI